MIPGVVAQSHRGPAASVHISIATPLRASVSPSYARGKAAFVQSPQSITAVSARLYRKNFVLTAASTLTLGRLKARLLALGTASLFNLTRKIAKTIGALQSQAVSGIPLDPSTAAWKAAVITAGGTVSDPRLASVNNLVLGLKAAGLFTKLDRLWLFAAENSQSALVDIINAASASLVATNPTFTANRGFTGNGVGYINTGVNASTGGPWKYLQNDAHWSWWNLTASIASLSNQQFHGSNQSSVGMQVFSNAVFFRVNQSTGGSATIPGSIGHFIGSRNGASLNNNYFNGSLFFPQSGSSGAIPNNAFRVLFADSGSPSISQCAAYSIGGNLDGGSDAVNFYNLLRTYMTAVGVP